MQRMRTAAERYMLLNEIQSSPDEIELVAARWTEELLASKLGELPDTRTYDDPDIEAAAAKLYASVESFLTELYTGLTEAVT